MTIDALDLLHRLCGEFAVRRSVREATGKNDGPEVERIQSITGNKLGDPWCASFVTWMGTLVLGKDWPIAKTGGVADMVAKTAKARVLPASQAKEGDVFCLWYESMGRFAHTGFVRSVEKDGSVTTYEGNTSDPSMPGTREGWGAYLRKRRLGPKDVVLRWLS